MIFSRRDNGRDRIIVFGRYPIPGRVKTRLIPALGPVGAAELQRTLTERTIAAARPLGSRLGVGIEVCMEGGTERRIRRWLGRGIPYFPQAGGDLGNRMEMAFSRAFKGVRRRVLLLGTDIPGLRSQHLEQAFQGLAANDLVLGPSKDGGYWLLGLKRPCALFHGIEWGTGKVLWQTLEAAKALGLKVLTLQHLRDVDTIEDLKGTMPEEALPVPYLSVIIPALNEAARIEAVVGRSLNRDAEVIVVDGGSTDETAERAAGAGARVMTARRGRACQQNRGAAAARGKILLFLHADTLLPEDYMAHVFETMMDPGTVLGAFRFKTDLNRLMMRLVEFLSNIRSRSLHLPYGDQALFVRRPDFESVGGFPEVPIAEDLSMVRLLSKRGGIGIVPADAVTSGRRWQQIGIIRTTLTNQIILGGCVMGVPRDRLAPLYSIQRRAKERKNDRKS